MKPKLPIIIIFITHSHRKTTDIFHAVLPPEVTGNSDTAKVGENASLSCNMTSTVPEGAAISYQWMRKNTNLNVTSAVYHISSVSTLDADVHTCQVTIEANSANVIPATTSLNVTLTVNGE